MAKKYQADLPNDLFQPDGRLIEDKGAVKLALEEKINKYSSLSTITNRLFIPGWE